MGRQVLIVALLAVIVSTVSAAAWQNCAWSKSDGRNSDPTHTCYVDQQCPSGPNTCGVKGSSVKRSTKFKHTLAVGSIDIPNSCPCPVATSSPCMPGWVQCTERKGFGEKDHWLSRKHRREEKKKNQKRPDSDCLQWETTLPTPAVPVPAPAPAVGALKAAIPPAKPAAAPPAPAKPVATPPAAPAMAIQNRKASHWARKAQRLAAKAAKLAAKLLRIQNKAQSLNLKAQAKQTAANALLTTLQAAQQSLLSQLNAQTAIATSTAKTVTAAQKAAAQQQVLVLAKQLTQANANVAAANAKAQGTGAAAAGHRRCLKWKPEASAPPKRRCGQVADKPKPPCRKHVVSHWSFCDNLRPPFDADKWAQNLCHACLDSGKAWYFESPNACATTWPDPDEP